MAHAVAGGVRDGVPVVRRPDVLAVAAALVEARAGDGRALLAAAGRLFGRSDTGRYAPMLGASHAIACADRPRPTTEEVVARWRRDREAAPLFGELLGPDLTCVAWPTAPAPWVSPRAEGAPPILVVGVTGDSATPYEWATELAGGLASARLLTLDGVGHIGYGRDDCVDAAVRAYLVDGRLPEVGARCG